jgi:hypothetical protein
VSRKPQHPRIERRQLALLRPESGSFLLRWEQYGSSDRSINVVVVSCVSTLTRDWEPWPGDVTVLRYDEQAFLKPDPLSFPRKTPHRFILTPPRRFSSVKLRLDGKPPGNSQTCGETILCGVKTLLRRTRYQPTNVELGADDNINAANGGEAEATGRTMANKRGQWKGSNCTR